MAVKMNIEFEVSPYEANVLIKVYEIIRNEPDNMVDEWENFESAFVHLLECSVDFAPPAYTRDYIERLQRVVDGYLGYALKSKNGNED